MAQGPCIPVFPLLRHVYGIGIYRTIYFLPLERNRKAILNTWITEGDPVGIF